jgi:ATP-binding cassette subfamily F protein uup
MANAPPLLLLQDIALTFGGTPLLDGVELSVGAGERICLVGRNGSGKSTLMKIAAGLVEADSGPRFLQPSATIRYLPQEPDLTGFATVEAFVEAGLAPGDDRNRARRMLQFLGLSGEEDPQRLSGGETRRAALARTLAPEPDILLLDEPTNHLDLPAIEQLEQTLMGLRSALVLVSHDRRFLESLSDRTIWIDRGKTRRLDKGFRYFEAWRDTMIEEEEREAHKLDRRIEDEQHWLRFGVTARRKRNVRRLDRLHALRDQRRRAKANRRPGAVTFEEQDAGSSGKLVIEATGIAKSFGDRTIVRDLTLLVERGDKVGIVGPNGAGKTTLINLLTGQLPPDSGSVRLGTNLEMATVDQRRESLDGDKTLADILTDGRGDTVIVGNVACHVVGYAKDFLFKPEQVRSPVKALSGGERGRLMLARTLARPSNLLVLDEPTNDLDLETLDLLQEMLADYSGTLLLVSHDRDFLDRVATSVVASDGDGLWTEYAGGYSDMVAQRGRGIGARAAPAAIGVASPPRPKARRTAAEPKRKLSFKEQHALTTLPERIEALTREVASLESRLSDPGFYARDADGFAAATGSLDRARADLSAAEEEWLRLEMLREAAEGA